MLYTSLIYVLEEPAGADLLRSLRHLELISHRSLLDLAANHLETPGNGLKAHPSLPNSDSINVKPWLPESIYRGK